MSLLRHNNIVRGSCTEQISLQTAAKNRQCLRICEVVWQTIVDSRGGDWKSLVAVRRQLHMADNQR